ncbi:MAG: endonuclease/exonuclease/phosphatase family protein [Gemmatimonadota bacterium]
MPRLVARTAVPLLSLAFLLLAAACGQERAGDDAGAEPRPSEPARLRVAQFNIWELSQEKVDDVDARGRGVHEQLVAAAEVLKEVRPDVILINEIDIRQDGAGPLEGTWTDFQERYLAAGEDALRYEHVVAPPVNTGVLSGEDLNNDGVVATAADRGTRTHGDDSFGYGEYPGQYGMVLASRHPLDTAAVRTFRKFLWRDMPGNRMPPGWYSAEAEAVFRLSSKTHVVVPLRVAGRTIQLVGAHPTPMGFDGAEDRNGRRNGDEVRMIVDLIDGADYLVDDEGVRGGLPAGASFVVLGDLNASPHGGEVDPTHPIHDLLAHPRVHDTGDICVSAGGLAGREPGPPAHFERSTTGRATGWRIDYVLPSTDLEVAGGGVYFPDVETDPVGAERADAASDHRLVWVDLVVD